MLVYGINKFCGTISDRERIATKYEITNFDVVSGKSILLKNTSPDWFITNKEDRQFVELFD